MTETKKPSSQEKALKTGPHEPSKSKRVQNTYLDDKPEKAVGGNSSLKAIIFDESADIIDEGISDYAKAFWRGLTGQTYGDLANFVDTNIDPKKKTMIRVMNEPLTIEEQWMVNNSVMSEKEIMRYRYIKNFIALYQNDILNNSPNILPGAADQLKKSKEFFPFLNHKYRQGVVAAQVALGLRASKRGYYPNSGGSNSLLDDEDDDVVYGGGVEKPKFSGEVEKYKSTLEKRHHSLIGRTEELKDGLAEFLADEKLISRMQIRRKVNLQTIQKEVADLHKELSNMSSKEFEQLFHKKYGTSYQKGPWQHIVAAAASAYSNLKKAQEAHDSFDMD